MAPTPITENEEAVEGPALWGSVTLATFYGSHRYDKRSGKILMDLDRTAALLKEATKSHEKHTKAIAKKTAELSKKDKRIEQEKLANAKLRARIAELEGAPVDDPPLNKKARKAKRAAERAAALANNESNGDVVMNGGDTA